MVNTDIKVAGVLREERSGNAFLMDSCLSLDKT
jgi:hypothetical protein